ncbi:hypothetical protein [Veillonella caviae]|uniref:hypothetical protein n=1 Tax=Veillonella caviae TaxID=248316 RepID=UPI0023A7BADD|nr:hypothetical protein [Veillonella caviae]MCI5708685.1 hypothetical protein [Veillonella caviae]MDY5716004.1 hypothetical protein [Veillonella caviae]
MTLAELYAKLEGIEGGQELINGFKSEISKINEAAKADRLKHQEQITSLTTARDELQGKIDEYEANAGKKSPDMVALEKQVKTLSDKYEKAEAARIEEIQKRTNSEISAQTIAALTKLKAIDPQTVQKLVSEQIKVQDDGTYGWNKDDGTIGTIEECATAFLADKPYLVQTSQNAGSGAGAGNGAGDTQLAEMFKIAGVQPPKAE